MINVPLLQERLDFLKNNPHLHNQGVWLERTPGCGTAGCIAGWTALQARPDLMEWQTVRHDLIDGKRVAIQQAEFLITGEEVCEVAIMALGLTAGQSGFLFEDSNTLHDLYLFAWFFTSGQILIPSEVTGQTNLNFCDFVKDFEADPAAFDFTVSANWEELVEGLEVVQ